MNKILLVLLVSTAFLSSKDSKNDAIKLEDSK